MLRLVKSAEQMDDQTLIKHFNKSHMPISGLSEVVPKPHDPGEKLLRVYHERVHNIGYDDILPNRRDVDHEHEQG